MRQITIFNYIIGTALLGIFLFFGSCRKDFESEPSMGQLEFSADTIYLDTVFSTIGSSTYQLKVYNKSGHDVSVPHIQLAQGQDSYYRLNVDGAPGKSFDDIDILAKDSIFIFIETTADIEDFSSTNNQFLYTDQIEFDTDLNQQEVELVTLVQDAHFLYPEKFDDGSTETLTLGYNDEDDPIEVKGFYLNEDALHFTADKPYVIYGYAAVPPHKTLTIDPGVRVHFHQEGGLLVANQASLHVNGEMSNDPEELENEVIFQGDRLEPDYKDTPGQWQTIWLTDGSTDNIINHATIKNGTVGLRVDNNDGSPAPTVKINNTQIYNCSTLGIMSLTGHIEGKNIAINNCGQASLYLALGGTYNFYNSTFTNYWTNGFRDFPAVLVSNAYETPETLFVSDLTEANFYNCIIYGNQNIELQFSKSDEAAFNYSFQNSLIRFNDINNIFGDNPLYDFEDTDHFKDNIFNEDPVFFETENNLLNIDDSSPANGLADPATATSTDILGIPRGNNPDSGAYESMSFPEDD